MKKRLEEEEEGTLPSYVQNVYIYEELQLFQPKPSPSPNHGTFQSAPVFGCCRKFGTECGESMWQSTVGEISSRCQA